MRLLLLGLLFVLHSALGAVCTQARIEACALEHLDTDNSGSITVAEINHYIAEKPCGETALFTCGDTVVAACDTNGNGTLEPADLTSTPNCLGSDSFKKFTCQLCDQCDAASAQRRLAPIRG